MQPRDDAPTLPAPDQRHTLFEDVYALLVGCVLLVLGLVLLKGAGLVTGGIAGIALLISYLLPGLPPGLLFTLLNLPFFAFAGRFMGARFMLKTMLVNAGIALLSVSARLGLSVEAVHPLFASLVGGTIIGLGILVLARHNASVGGAGVVTLWLQKTRGINAGRTQIAIDIVILLASLIFLSGGRFAWSALSAAAISIVLILWHRPGRYTGY